jgi:hypothetical protein
MYFREKKALQLRESAQNESIDDCVRKIAAYVIEGETSKHSWVATFKTPFQFDRKKVLVSVEVLE